MCGPKVPKAQKAPPPVAEIPRLASKSVKSAGDRERRNQANAKGRSSTLLTGGRGVTSPANTGTKTLLGQ